MKILTTAEMRDVERAADQAGVSYPTMMENAGAAVADVVAERFAPDAGNVLVLVGPGNNGGDGLVAARRLHELGYSVRVYIWKRAIEGDDNFRRVESLKIGAVWAEKDKGLARLRGWLKDTAVVVDAMLGTGASRPIEGTLQDVLRQVAAARQERPVAPAPRRRRVAGVPEPRSAGRSPAVVAVDVPSGLDCDSGRVDPATVPAEITVTFAYPKVGQFSNEACGVLGELVVADIGIPGELAPDVCLELITDDWAARLLPSRPRCSHKGTFGKALIVAGSVNYTGAACLAAAAAGRTGAGLVTLGIPRALHVAIASQVTEATYLLLPHEMGVLSADAVGLVRGRIKDCDALLVGPGLTSEKETVEFVHELLGVRVGARRGAIGFGRVRSAVEERGEAEWKPLVLDADALNALAGADRWWESLPDSAIVTPHPGEMARLLGRSVADVEGARIETARQAASNWRTIVVLKGAHSVVAAPDGRTAVSPFANPALATAGTGDVLAGAIVALLAQGVGAFEAAIAGVYLHGLAGELTRREVGVGGAVAGDVLERLPEAARLLRGE